MHYNKTVKSHKERILKVVREKQLIMYKGAPIKLLADFSAETLQARREWDNIFKVLKRRKLPAGNSISGKTDLQKLRRN